MKCNCTENCIKTKDKILENIETKYLPCPECTTKTLKKAIPIQRQVKLEEIDKNYKLCPKCNKRHIDYVMAHILKILIDNNFSNTSSSIRKVGTPLITPAIYLERLPYLSDESLTIIIKDIDEKTAKIIKEEVPEVKAVIKGDVNQTIGQLTEKDNVHNYQLMAGCDIRCDIQQTPTGPLTIYKQQSNIHIEYPKPKSPKIEDLDYMLKKYENPTVIDAMCGVGTLGIYALTKNAKKVIFNDINPNAIDNLKTNLEINDIKENCYEIYNENILDLIELLDETYDIVILDAFPNIDTTDYEEKLKKIAKELILI